MPPCYTWIIALQTGLIHWPYAPWPYGRVSWPGQGYCPPRVINRTMIHFASLVHWEFLLAALGTARHKSQLTWQSLLPRAKNTIWYEVWYENLSKNDVISTYITRCRPSQSIKMSYNKHCFWTAIRPITIRKYWMRFSFQEEKHICVVWFWEAGGGSLCDIHEILPPG